MGDSQRRHECVRHQLVTSSASGGAGEKDPRWWTPADVGPRSVQGDAEPVVCLSEPSAHSCWERCRQCSRAGPWAPEGMHGLF